MKWERMILVSFFGNYIINTIIAGIIVAIMPASTTKGITSPQYVVFALVSAIFVALFTCWYFKYSRGTLISGTTFGVVGFLIAIASTFVSALAGTLVQTGSFSQAFAIVPNFGPFLWNWATLVLIAVWVIPAAIVGMMQERSAPKM
ncbi:MAG: hypothetical protein JWO50_464 [Candidatus Kaiserbacteria bacterium]|nr:hypothetical protein [Candidatus Kaiserbacteria bacterium]